MPAAALIGSYLPPAARVGRRVRCLYRGAWCKVTSWTEAPISWPRVLPAGGRGDPGLLVTTELRRAIRTESAEALKHWFGISTLVAWKLRTWAGVEGHTRTAGSRRLQQEVSERGAAGMKAKVWTEAELDARSELAKSLGLKPTGRWGRDGWTPEPDALLGTDHDDVYKPYAIYDGTKWLLWYNGRKGGVEQIGLAIHDGEELGF
jgi:hypothetical protein